MRSSTRTLAMFAAALLAAIASAGRVHADGILVGDGSDGEVRVVSHRVGATLRDHVADVVVEQTFESDTTHVVDGTYLFPLPPGFAAGSLAVRLDFTAVVAEVLDASQARRVYAGIVAKRRDPSLLARMGAGLVRLRIPEIGPGRSLTIRLWFRQLLEGDATTLLWRCPWSIDSFATLPSTFVDVEVDVESTVDLKAVYCPSHAVTVTRDGERRARVVHRSQYEGPVGDFLLYLERSPDDIGFSVVSGKAVAEEGVFLAVLAPRVAVDDARRVPVDVVYVLDTSASMRGAKIAQARAALVYGLRRLRRDDRFSVLGFATGVRAFRDGFVAAAPATVEDAVAWLDTLPAEGDMNPSTALEEAVKLRFGDRLPMIVLVTDGPSAAGEDDTEAMVSGLMTRNVSKARIFTFGVGPDIDVKLLDRLAIESGGTSAYVAADENLEDSMGRFFRRVDQPVLTDVTVDFGDGVHDVYPSRMPDLFAGEPVVVVGRYTTAGPRVVTLKGVVGRQQLAWSHSVTLRDGPGPAALTSLWAHRKVAYLLDELRLRGRSDDLVDEVMRLATRHGLEILHSSRPATDRGLRVEGSPQGPGARPDPARGPGGAFRSRFGRRVLRGGAGNRADDAVEDALKWLAAHQAPDGGLDARDAHGWCDREPQPDDVATGAAATRPARRVGATARAMEAFLCAGATHHSEWPDAGVISRGLRFLRMAQGADGFVGDRGASTGLLDHAYATLALVEAHGMTGSSVLARWASDALAALRAGQAPDGSFGSPEATAAAALAFESAWRVATADWRTGRRSAFEGEMEWIPTALEAVHGWAVTARGAGDPTAAAVELLVGATLGRPNAGEAVARVAAALDAASVWMGAADALAWDVGLLALRRVGGEPWNAAQRRLRLLMDARLMDTNYCVRKGSWDPADDLGLGRVGATAVGALACGVYHRYDDGSLSRSALLRARPPVPIVPANDAETSRALRDAKDATSVGDAGDALRTVAGRTFRRDARGRFVETSWDGTRAPVAVEAFSPRYFALSAASDEVARILALGERVVFVHQGEVLEIVPAPTETAPVK